MSNDHIFPPDDVTDFFQEQPDQPKTKATEKSFTWSANVDIEYRLLGYTIQSYLERHADSWFTIVNKRSAMVRFGLPDRNGDSTHSNMIMTGLASFVINGQIYCYEADYQNDTHRIFSNHNVQPLIEKLRHVIHNENPARRHYLQFYNDSRAIEFHVRPVPSVSLDEVILDPEMLEDIVDNTIAHLDCVDGANGVIFHGVPGTGKSLAAQAIAAEAMRRGYSASYVAGRIDFEKLDDFVREYLTPGVLILEDIDTFSESRKSHQQYGFSDFLQFMSGLFERNQKTVVIATTNYLKFLDDAIATRPVRFNRRYEFKLPGDHELERLFAQFFPDYSPGAELLADCRRRGFSGSHLAEVKRTTEILKHKHNCSAAEIINQAIEIVGGEFHADTKSAGF